VRDIFTYLCNFSVVTSIAIVVAVLLRPVLKKGPSFIRCALWALVFLRLLIPVGFSDLPFSVPTVFEAEETIMAPEDEAQAVVSPKDEVVKEEIKEENEGKEENNVIQQAPSKPVQKPISGTVTEPQNPQNAPVADTPIEENTATPKAENKVDVIKVLSLIWAVGAVLMLGYMLASNLVLKYRVRGAIVYDSRIRVLDRDCSPFVFGFFRPIIYIPASAKRSDWGYIIAHESTHIKRLDHIVKPLAFLALCLYWYNPLVWAAYILFSKDIEYACDERTVKTMESEDKKAYSLALLSVSQSTGRIFAPLSFGEVSVKERIKRVMKFKNSLWAMSLAAVICISLLIFIACTPDGENPASSDLSSEESSAVSGEESSKASEGNPILSIGYATEEEKATVTPNYAYIPKYNSGADDIIKIETDEEVSNFKFISIGYNNNEPFYMCEIYEVNEITPDAPFYLKTSFRYWYQAHGVCFNDEKGNTLFAEIKYTVEYGEQGEIFTDLHFEPIEKELVPMIMAPENMSITWVVGDTITLFIPDFTSKAGIKTRTIEEECTAENIVYRCIEEGLFPPASKIQGFEIRDRVGYLDMNMEAYTNASPFQDSAGKNAISDTFLKNFDDYIDNLVITYNGEEKTFDPVGDVTTVDPESISATSIIGNSLRLYYPEITASGTVTSYSFIHENCTAENLVYHSIEHGIFPPESKIQSFGIKNRVGYLDMNEQCYTYSYPFQISHGIDAFRMSFLESFKDYIDTLVITFGGKNLDEYSNVFQTGGINRITFYRYSGYGKGSDVPENNMQEIINWLATFTVGEKVPDEPVDGDNFIYVEIGYKDGTIVKVPLDTVTVNGVQYYTDNGQTPTPDCFVEILLRTSLD